MWADETNREGTRKAQLGCGALDRATKSPERVGSLDRLQVALGVRRPVLDCENRIGHVGFAGFSGRDLERKLDARLEKQLLLRREAGRRREHRTNKVHARRRRRISEQKVQRVASHAQVRRRPQGRPAEMMDVSWRSIEVARPEGEHEFAPRE